MMTLNQLLELFPLGDPFHPNQPGKRLFDPISAISSGIGMVGSLIGGAIGSSAATSGAKLINTADTTAATNTLATTASVNPSITNAGAAAGTGATDAATAAGAGATTAAATGAANVATTAGETAADVNTATGTANSLLDPYAQSGAAANTTLAAGVAPGGQFDSTPTLAQLQMDPGYAFRLQQGQTALDRSAAARGGVTSGGDIKAQTDYAQGAASQEYQNAFNRYETSTQNNYSNVSGVANRGFAAAGTEGANTIGAATYGGNVANTAAAYGSTLNANAAQYAGTAGINASQYAGTANINAANTVANNTIAAGNTANNYNVAGATATAQGKMGAANAWTGALNGIGNAASYSSFGGTVGSIFGPSASQQTAAGNFINSQAANIPPPPIG